MILTITASDRGKRQRELDDAFRLRHRIFVEEAGWEALRKADGREIDQFDDERAIHMLLYQEDSLIGYQRLLPTTSPNLLTDIYPVLCDGRPPSSPSIFEWTRLAVEPRFRGTGQGLGSAGAVLVHAMVEWCLGSEVDAVIVETAPIMMLKLVQCHFRIEPLGISHIIDGKETLALLAKFDHRTLSRLQEMIAAEQQHIDAAGNLPPSPRATAVLRSKMIS